MSAVRAEAGDAALGGGHDVLVAVGRGGRPVGRRRELAVVTAAAERAGAGEPAVVVVEGEAGIGKTCLVQELASVLADALVITGHGVEMSTGEIPFGVAADSLRDLLRTAGDDVLLRAERQVLAPLLPGAAAGAGGERVDLMSTFVDLLERLARDRLVVWVVEDVHWADSPTRDLVNLVVGTVVGRLLVVVTVRTDDPGRPPEAEAALASFVAGLTRRPGSRTVRLGRLSPAEVRAQLAGLATELTPATIARIEELSDGVPFVAEELAAAAGRSELVSASTVASARLALLPAEARRLVEAAAVGEGHLRVTLLEQVVDATPDELDTALVEAVRAGLLLVDPSDDTVAFRHALLREAAAREIGPGARRSWHRRWAEVLETARGVLAADPAALAIAEHWHHARDVRRAVRAAVAALPAAERIGTSEHEVRLGLRILEAWDAVGDDLPISHRSAVATTLRAAVNAGRHSSAGAIDRVRTDDPQIGLLLHFLRSRQGLPKGRPAEEAALLLASSLETEPWPDDLLTALALNLAANSLPVGDPRPDAFLDRSLAITADQPGSHLHAGARGIRAICRMREGRFGPAAELIREALADPAMPAVDRWFQEGNLVWALIVGGDIGSVDEVAEPALTRVSRPQAEPYPWEHLVENVAIAWVLRGDWARARHLLEQNAPYWPDEHCYARLWLDLLDVRQGRSPDLSRWTTVEGGSIAAGPVPEDIRWVLATAAVQTDLAEARRLMQPVWADSGDLITDIVGVAVCDAARWEADARMTADPAGAAAAPDAVATAAAHLAVLVATAQGLPRIGALGEVWPLDLEAQLDRFHGRDARGSLEAALHGWQRIGHVPDVAVTHLALAEAHAMHGERQVARGHLASGRDIAAGLDCRSMLDRADAIAARFALSGPERGAGGLLTERETEVLRLIAEGRSNAEIGATLFMSPKTASVHVSRIITKLAVANRTEAAAYAHRNHLV